MTITPVPAQLLFPGPFDIKGNAKNMKTSLTTTLLAMMTITARPEIITLTSVDRLEQGVQRHKTQSIEISNDQTIELLSIVPYIVQKAFITIEKDGEQTTIGWGDVAAYPTSLLTMRGPAKLTLATYSGAGTTYATFRITPERVDPTQTAIVYPGTNNAAKVTMLCSTNLADWSPATNGLYSGDVAKFFRIGIEKTEK